METEKEIQETTENSDSNGLLPSSRPFTHYIDGFPLPGIIPEENYRFALTYKPRPTDIFVASYPKCGTTWTQYIVLLLYRKGKPITTMSEWQMCTPYLEMMSEEACEMLLGNVVIKTHLPCHYVLRSANVKYIYVTRNPKDCCVSYFHHMKNIPLHGFNGTFDEFFELFITGDIDFGDFFDHLLEWYEHRNDANVLLLTYEEMKENPRETVLKIASFIDDELYAEPLRTDPQELEIIIQNSSFEAMKQPFNQEIGNMFNLSKEEVDETDLPQEIKNVFQKCLQVPSGGEKKESIDFVRKGIIGDWRNHLSENQSRRLNEKFEEKLKGIEIANMWRKYM